MLHPAESMIPILISILKCSDAPPLRSAYFISHTLPHRFSLENSLNRLSDEYTVSLGLVKEAVAPRSLLANQSTDKLCALHFSPGGCVSFFKPIEIGC
jgi:hypothetical protein